MKIRNNIKVALICTVTAFPVNVLLHKFGKCDEACFVMFSLFTVALLSIFLSDFGEFIHKIFEKVGHCAGNIISVIILFFVFIFAVLPTGLIMKLVHRDRLRLKKPDTKTYWIDVKEEIKDYEYQF